MSTDFRALCDELADKLAACWPSTFDPPDCLNRARAALAAEANGQASVVGEPSDEELLDEWHKAVINLPGDSWSSTGIAFARAVLSRYGHQPAPPAAGEVGELARQLGVIAADAEAADFVSDATKLTRAAALLEQRHPVPVPVNERLPGPEDCDAEGRCWWFCFECPGEHPHWILAKEVYCDPIHCLPFHALPLPQGEVEP